MFRQSTNLSHFYEGIFWDSNMRMLWHISVDTQKKSPYWKFQLILHLSYTIYCITLFYTPLPCTSQYSHPVGTNLMTPRSIASSFCKWYNLFVKMFFSISWRSGALHIFSFTTTVSVNQLQAPSILMLRLYVDIDVEKREKHCLNNTVHQAPPSNHSWVHAASRCYMQFKMTSYNSPSMLGGSRGGRGCVPPKIFSEGNFLPKNLRCEEEK